jgi:hypothetical protein
MMSEYKDMSMLMNIGTNPSNAIVQTMIRQIRFLLNYFSFHLGPEFRLFCILIIEIYFSKTIKEA